MRSGPTFVLTEALHQVLREHLFPGDGLEAAALVVCSRHDGVRAKFIARSVILVPHAECERRTDFVRWPGDYLEQAIEASESERLSVVLVHSHPGGLLAFSDLDDESDRQTMRSLFAGVEVMHGSAIMVDDGRMRARFYDHQQTPTDAGVVSVVGDDINLYLLDDTSQVRQSNKVMAFSDLMTQTLSSLSIAVIGVSGTGSIVAEQLARLGVGELILIDHDQVEAKNLNRILNSTLSDAQKGVPKVEMFAEAVGRCRAGCMVRPIALPIETRSAVLAAADADVVFSCVDSYHGRMIADRIASCFLIPLLDVGVSIPTRMDEQRGVVIADVCGRIDYVKPGGSTLADRGIYTSEKLQGEYLKSRDPRAFEDQLERGYIRGFHAEAPAVIPLNMAAGASCVLELLARIFPMREERNARYARTAFSYTAAEQEFSTEDEYPRAANPLLASGSTEPLLGLPDL